jgi:tetratricopeptide (TPR) repeat protein
MRSKRDDSPMVPFGSRACFQMLLDGGPQRTAADQGWENAVQKLTSWLDKRGEGAQALESPREKTIKEPWRTVPRWKLNRALASLPHGYREVFEMHERLGYTHKDIAEHFGCSVGNSKSQLHRARSNEAQQRLTSGQAAAKSAQIPKELKAAASEFQSALRIAPWLASGYFNLGDVQEKLRDYPAAARSFELYLLAAPSAQDAQSVQKKIIDLHCRFPAMYLQTHSIFTQSALRPAWALDSSGELTLSNDSVQFRDTRDAKHSFAFQISDLRSLERRRGPEGFPVLRMKLQNGKKYDLVPDVFGQLIATGDKGMQATQKAMDEAVNAMEKAVKDAASQHGIVLK